MKITKGKLRQIIREEVQRAKALPRLSEQEEKSLVKDLNDRVAKIEKDLGMLFVLFAPDGIKTLHDDIVNLYDRTNDIKMLADTPKKAEKNVPDPLREDND